VHRDHHIGRLHHDDDMALRLDAELIDRLVGDGRSDDVSAADIDAYVRGGRALFHFDDGTLDLVACTDAHGDSFQMLGRARQRRALLARIEEAGPTSHWTTRLRRKWRAILAHFDTAGIAAPGKSHGLASGAVSTWRQSVGNCASVSGGRGFGGLAGGFGCSTESLNQ